MPNEHTDIIVNLMEQKENINCVLDLGKHFCLAKYMEDESEMAAANPYRRTQYLENETFYQNVKRAALGKSGNSGDLMEESPEVLLAPLQGVVEPVCKQQ